jgi:hypothetical protein
MANIFRFSQVRTLQGEGFKLGDALRLAYKDIYYTQFRKNKFIFDALEAIYKGIMIFIPFIWVFFL